jgi:hypothetical protein
MLNGTSSIDLIATVQSWERDVSLMMAITVQICEDCSRKLHQKQETKARKLQVQLQKEKKIINKAKDYIWNHCNIMI